MSSDRGRYSKVSRRIWNSESFQRLTQPKMCGAWLFMRLLTGPELTNIPGLFQGWEAGLAQALKCSLKDFRNAMAEVLTEDMVRVDWTVGLIWLPSAIHHNEPESVNVILGWRSAWQELPECELKDQAKAKLMAWAKAKGEPWAKAFEKASAKTRAIQEQEQEQEQINGGAIAEGQSEHYRLRVHYAAEFQRTKGLEHKLTSSQGGRYAKAAAELLKTFGFDEAKAIITRALDDPWQRENAPELWSIAAAANKFRGPKGSGKTVQPSHGKTGWERKTG